MNPEITPRQARDRIEAELDSLTPTVRQGLCGNYHRWPATRRMAAGVLRKAFMPELARMRATEETLARVTQLIRGHAEDGTVPVRRALDALYGEEQ